MTRTIAMAVVLCACSRGPSGDQGGSGASSARSASGASGGAVTCRAAIQHGLDVFLASDRPDADKQRAKARLDDGIEACEAQPPPQITLDCIVNAKTMSDLDACDRLPEK